VSDDVSRETPPPDLTVLAQLVPPHRLSLLEQYAGLLADQGVVRGLIGPREVPRLWERHLVNCALVAPSVAEGASVADLGAGAGLPGIVLGIARPDLHLTLVEPMARRVEFLREACGRLGLDEISIVRGRAEELRGRRTFEVVTARALAALPKLLDMAMPLVAPGGCLLAMKGSSAAAEIEASRTQLGQWKARAEVISSSVPGSETTTLVRVVPGVGSGIGWGSGSARRQRRDRA
jgi:16S rRNA (guanine527-N7)-methyltransferase